MTSVKQLAVVDKTGCIFFFFKTTTKQQKYDFVWLLYFVWHIILHGLFIAKAIRVKEKAVILLYPLLGDSKVHTFPKGINPKVNVIALLEFELPYFVVQQFGHDAKKIPTPLIKGAMNVILSLNIK